MMIGRDDDGSCEGTVLHPQIRQSFIAIWRASLKVTFSKVKVAAPRAEEDLTTEAKTKKPRSASFVSRKILNFNRFYTQPQSISSIDLSGMACHKYLIQKCVFAMTNPLKNVGANSKSAQRSLSLPESCWI